MRTLLALLFATALLAAGCRTVNRPVAEIDWVDFVKVNGVTYTADYRQEAPLTEERLGTVYSKVRYQVAENVTDPGYRSKDGDAAFLEPGTLIYRVSGYDPRFRLAARREQRIILYEADRNPKAEVGADLFDLEGKVTLIRIGDAADDRTLAEIRSPELVAALVDDVLKAPALAEKQGSGLQQGNQYFITFVHTDRTTSTRPFWPETGLLAGGYGLQMPDRFASAIRQALAVAASPGEPIDCGTEKRTYRSPVDAKGRQCLLEAYYAGQPAVFEMIVPTIEGDPITQKITVGPAKVQVSVDTTKDRFSAEQDRKVTILTCGTLKGEPRTHGDLRLRLENCTGAEGTEVLL